MSEPTSAGGQLRTLAVRITEGLRAQLDVVAQITGRSTTEEIRMALEHWVEKVKSDPETLKKAEQIRAAIERDALTRYNAITAIFGGAGEDPGAGTDGDAGEDAGAGTDAGGDADTGEDAGGDADAGAGTSAGEDPGTGEAKESPPSRPSTRRRRTGGE